MGILTTFHGPFLPCRHPLPLPPLSPGNSPPPRSAAHKSPFWLSPLKSASPWRLASCSLNHPLPSPGPAPACCRHLPALSPETLPCLALGGGGVLPVLYWFCLISCPLLPALPPVASRPPSLNSKRVIPFSGAIPACVQMSGLQSPSRGAWASSTQRC